MGPIMHTKMKFAAIFLLCFNLFAVHFHLSSFVENQFEKNDEKDHYIQALASLIFHVQEWKRHLKHEELENSSFETDCGISFTEEDSANLWNRTAHYLNQSPKESKTAKVLEQAYNAYYLAKNLVLAEKYTDAEKNLKLTHHLLHTLWEEAIEVGISEDLPNLITSTLIQRRQSDPNFDHNPHISPKARKKIYAHLLPLQHPIRAFLDSIFLQVRATKDSTTFRQAGFITLAARPRSFVRVASHPHLRGYLVKAYLDTVLSKKYHRESWEWLVKRCEGADKIRRIIRKRKIKHFSVPYKWIYCLPPEPSPPKDSLHKRHLALLCVKNMHLVPREENYYAWSHNITEEHLDELFVIISHAKGASYRPDNIAYTKKGQFAFIDTEYPNHGPDFKSIRKYLNFQMCAYWDHIVSHGG